MSNKPQLRMPVTERYKESLTAAIEKLGRNKSAKAIKKAPSTIHRNIREESLTYGNAMELVRAINKAELTGDDGAIIELPPPVVPVVDLAHYRFCELGKRLAEYPAILDDVIRYALDKVQEAERDRLLGDIDPKLRSPT